MSEALLEKILTEVTGIRHDIVELRSDVATLKTDVAELKSDVATLKTDVAELKSDMKFVKTELSILKSDLDTANYRLERIENVQAEMKKSMLDQKEIISILSARSIEHEAALKRIN